MMHFSHVVARHHVLSQQKICVSLFRPHHNSNQPYTGVSSVSIVMKNPLPLTPSSTTQVLALRSKQPSPSISKRSLFLAPGYASCESTGIRRPYAHLLLKWHLPQWKKKLHRLYAMIRWGRPFLKILRFLCLPRDAGQQT